MDKILSKLSRLRFAVDMTQKEVAEYLGIHQKTYARIERGERELVTSQIIKLCELYNVDANFLLGFEES